MKPDTLLTVKEVADMLQLNLLTVYDYIRKGQLAAVKLGRNYRIIETDLENFIKDHRVSEISNLKN